LFVLVCFDIVDDKDRRQAVKIIGDYGCRVQKSVFECSGISEEQYLKMKIRLEGCIDNILDTVRYYRICKDCIRKMEYSGIGDPQLIKAFRIV